MFLSLKTASFLRTCRRWSLGKSKDACRNSTEPRAFTIMKNEIGFMFSGIALPGLKIEHLRISASKDENKSLALKELLKNATRFLKPGELTLILTSTHIEANDLYKYLASSGELLKFMDINSIHFGPISSPPLTSTFGLVVYYSMPSKMEQLFGHVSSFYNNNYYKKYGKLSELPRIHFHVFASQDDFVKQRLKLFNKFATRLQVHRLFKYLDDHYNSALKQEDATHEEILELTTKLFLKDLGSSWDMWTSMIAKTLKYWQIERLLTVSQPCPTSYNLRIVNSSRDNQLLKKVLENSKKFSGVYQVRIEQVAENLGVSHQETFIKLKQLQTQGLITLEVEEEVIDVKFYGPISQRMNEVSESVYKKIKHEFDIENNLLKYLYLSLRIGSTPTKNIFKTKPNQNLQSLMKQYALAEQPHIEQLFSEKLVHDVMSPVRGNSDEHDEINQVYLHLLSKNKHTFLKSELEMWKGDSENSIVGLEYVSCALVKTMWGQPPKKTSLFDLNIRSSKLEFHKFDFEILVEIATKALENYLNTSNV